MVEMVEEFKPYLCKECGQDTLFFVTNRGNLIDYKLLIHDYHYDLAELKKLLYHRNIRFIKCINCNKTYIIDWRDRYPTTLIHKQDLKDFGL